MKFQGTALLCLAFFLLVTFAQAQSSGGGDAGASSSGGASGGSSASGSGAGSSASGSDSASASSSGSGADASSSTSAGNMVHVPAILGAFAAGSAFVLA